MGPIVDVTVRLEDDRPVIEHTCNGQRSTAMLDNVRWTVEQADPLTVRPSFHCIACNLYGWISQGEFWGTPGGRP